MRYVGMIMQIQRNNRLSVLLLLMFPIIILGTVYMFFFILGYLGGGYYDKYGNWIHSFDISEVNQEFVSVFPWVVLIVAVWFLIAYKYNTWSPSVGTPGKSARVQHSGEPLHSVWYGYADDKHR